MTDAGVDFLAVASRVAQGRYPLLKVEISNLELEERGGCLDAIFDGIVYASSINNQYDAARSLMKAHSLTDSRVPRIERYLNSIFTETGEIRPEVREELGEILERESLLDQALMMMRLRGEVRLAAEYLCDMVTDYDVTLRTEARFEQPGRKNLKGMARRGTAKPSCCRIAFDANAITRDAPLVAEGAALRSDGLCASDRR